MPPKTSIFLAYFHTKKEDSKRRHQKIHVTWSEAISMKLSVLLCSFHESDSGRGDTMGFEVVGRVWVFFLYCFCDSSFVSFSFDCNLLQRPLIFLDRSCSPQRTPAPLNDTQEIHVGHNASNGFKLEIGQLEYRTFLLPAITRKTRKHTYCTWNFCFCANLVCSTYSEFSYQVLQVPITWTKTLDVSVKKGFQHGVPVPQEQRSQQSFSGHGSGSTSTGCLALSSSFAMCGSCVWGFPSELAETGRGRGEKESPSFWEIWSGIVL